MASSALVTSGPNASSSRLRTSAGQRSLTSTKADSNGIKAARYWRVCNTTRANATFLVLVRVSRNNA
ncbi:hypothetical protein D3C86_2097710 [compost metagenome]